jgi:succinyl-CoA synthetase alpha subunit
MSILANAGTRILVQGITGREAATFVGESIQYGAQIIAGVTPGKEGLMVNGVPVFDTVANAIKAAPCNATIISVPANSVRDAAWEAFENGLRLAVIVTENIPRRDVAAILETASSVGARVIGPNSLGVISPGLTRIGMCGGKAADVQRAYKPGPVGVISRSGGMMTEIANMLTLGGIGQSTCVSIGGDPLIGSTILDLLPLYEADPQTRALVLFCEPGGTMEERLSEHLKDYPSRLPILAFVAGRFADRMQGQRFGHAGAIVEGKKGSPAGKVEVLKEAGVHVVEKLSQIPLLLGELLGKEL